MFCLGKVFLVGEVMLRYFVGIKLGLIYFDYSGKSLIGGSIRSSYRLYRSNDTELLLAVL